MAASKRKPMSAEPTGEVTPTTTPGGAAFEDGLGGETTTGFTPPAGGTPAVDGKRYSSAIGVEGTRVTDVKTGQVTYEGYKATPEGERTMQNLRPPGLAGDAFVPSQPAVEPKYFQEDLDRLSSLSRPTIAAWQSQLNAAGLLGDTFTIGVVDNATRSAYGAVLATANREGIEDTEALKLIQQNRIKIGGGGVSRYRLTNPSDLKAVIRSVAQNAIGRTLDDADVNRLVALFQAEELSAQKKYQAGGAVTEAPSAQAFVEGRIAQDFGEEVNTRKLDNVFAAVDKALGGGQ